MLAPIMSSVSGPAKIRVGIIGCGDVAHRWYLPALATLREMVALTACCDAGSGRAERATAAAAEWSPAATPYGDLDRPTQARQGRDIAPVRDVATANDRDADVRRIAR